MKYHLCFSNLSKVATKLKLELPTDIEMETVPFIELSSLAENYNVKAREASRNNDLDM